MCIRSAICVSQSQVCKCVSVCCKCVLCIFLLCAFSVSLCGACVVYLFGVSIVYFYVMSALCARVESIYLSTNRITNVKHQYLKSFDCVQTNDSVQTHLKMNLPTNYSLISYTIYIYIYIWGVVNY